VTGSPTPQTAAKPLRGCAGQQPVSILLAGFFPSRSDHEILSDISGHRDARTSGDTRRSRVMAKRAVRRPTALDVTVGRNVRVRRLAKGMSQAQLAGRLGVTFQQVQKYEVGSNRIGTGRLVKIAAILGVPISVLFEGANDVEPSQSLLALVS